MTVTLEGEKFGGASNKGWAEYAPPGWDRVKVSENLGATSAMRLR